MLSHDRCTGCGACKSACKTNSIQIYPDEEGFYYPQIDGKSCVDCGECTRVCPAMNIEHSDLSEPQVYAAWSLDEQIRYESTSGGIFTELAKAVIERGGLVAGAGYDHNQKVSHMLIDRVSDIPTLRQSKYVQSDTDDIYIKVKSVLDNKKPVLFTGTPCQCAGMASFLRKPSADLILCDFICRGVNSPMVYQKYLEELELRYASKIKRVWFKNKTFGWNKFGTKIIFDNGSEYFGGRDTDPFMYGYIKKGLNLYMRTSCGQCKYKGVKRPIDITLGDFWGIKLNDSDDDGKNGISFVMTHSLEGQKLMHTISDRVYCEKQNVLEALPFNRCIEESAIVDSEKRKLFFQLLETEPFSKAIAHFVDKNIGNAT